MLRRFYLFILLVTSVATAFAAETWRPVTPDILAIKAPKIDPEADAEALFSESWVDDYIQGDSFHHRTERYIRIKLFNNRAVQKYGDVKVEYLPSMSTTISDFKGRVLKPDGSVIEVKGNQVKETTIARTGGLSIRAKSFAFPKLEPGDIIEYRYNETVMDIIRYVRLSMQMDIPAWEISYNVRPLRLPGVMLQMRSYYFNCRPMPWTPLRVAGRDGFVHTQVNDVPALIREPQMPDEEDIKAWTLLYYTTEGSENPEKYWPSQGRKLAEEYRRNVKVNGDIKAVAAEVAGSLPTPAAKGDALAVYCQTKIRNTSYQAEGMKATDREEFFKSTLKDNYTSSDTLKQKIGRPSDIRHLFYALAEAAGLSPVYVAANGSDGPIFRKDFLDPYFVRQNTLVAIPIDKPNGIYRFYNPGSPYLPAGMPDAIVQGQPALLCDPKDPKLLVIPPADPKLSVHRRTANLVVSGTGGIEGEVKLVSTGYFGVAQKRYYDDKSPADREAELKKEYEARYSGAQITDLKVENADKVSGDFTVSFKIQMDGFVQRTGKRMFVQPGFFQFGKRAPFSASTRKYPVMYPHGYGEADAVTMIMPEGFALDAADMPGEIQLGKVGTYKFAARYQKEARSLQATRDLIWGNEGASWFPADAYPAIKQAWDKLHAADTHQITFRQQ
jgi:transglutaminase-like putative cysteine protease